MFDYGGEIINTRAKNNYTWSPNVFSMINWDLRIRYMSYCRECLGLNMEEIR